MVCSEHKVDKKICQGLETGQSSLSSEMEVTKLCADPYFEKYCHKESVLLSRGC